MNFSRFYRRFSQAPNFLRTFFPKVQISKFCSYKSMNWVQASMLKGFLRGLGTCHTFYNWVTKFSVFACPQLYVRSVSGMRVTTEGRRSERSIYIYVAREHVTEGLRSMVYYNTPPSGVESCGNETKGKTMFGKGRIR